MNPNRHPLSFSLPIAVLMMSGVIGFFLLAFVFALTRQDVLTSEKDMATTLGSVAASQLEYHLRHNQIYEARRALDRLKTDRSFLLALLVDDEQRVLLSTQRALEGQAYGAVVSEPGIALPSRMPDAAVHPVLNILRNPPSIVFFTPVYLSPGQNESSSTRKGVLVLQRELRTALQSHTKNFMEAGVGVIAGVLLISLGTWLILRRRLFQPMNLLLSSLAAKDSDFLAPEVLQGNDELSIVASALQDFSEGIRESNEMLVQSEKRFRSVFEQSAVGMATLAPDGRWMQLNRKLCQILDSTEEDLRQIRIHDVTHEHDAEKMLSVFEQLSQIDVSEYITDSRFITRASETVWIHAAISSVHDQGGDLAHYVAVIEDISDAVRIRQQLLRAQEIADVGNWQGDSRDGSLEWGSQVSKIFGIGEEQFAGTTEDFFEFVHPEDSESLRRAIKDWLESGALLDVTHRIVRADGQVRWVRELAKFADDPRENPHYTFGTLQDITDIVLARQEIEYQQSFLSSVLDSAPIGIAVCDRQGRLTLFNRMARHWHGKDALSTDPSQWTETYDLYQPDGNSLLPTDEVPLTRAYRGETVENQEFVISPPGRPAKFISANAVPIVDDQENLLGAVASMLDITERKKAEQALLDSYSELENRVRERTLDLKEANEKLRGLDRLKSMFIASMSHELRTPLNSIIGFTGMLTQEIPGPVNEKQKDYLSRIYGAGRHLLSLITDIIEISKLEAGKAEAERVRFDLVEATKESIGQVQLEADAKGLDVQFTGPDHLMIVSDRRRVVQCLLNYLSNALKYTEKGRINVELQCVAGNADEISISVTDTGIGIHPEDHDKLFRQFSRVDSELSRETSGSGLGLYLTRKIMTDLLGGRVSFESEPGNGSVFRLHFPRSLEA